MLPANPAFAASPPGPPWAALGVPRILRRLRRLLPRLADRHRRGRRRAINPDAVQANLRGPLVLVALLPNLLLGIGPAVVSWWRGSGPRGLRHPVPVVGRVDRALLRRRRARPRASWSTWSCGNCVFHRPQQGVAQATGTAGGRPHGLARCSRSVYAVIVAPVNEEMLMRGALWGALEHYRVPKLMILGLTALVFALLHQEPTLTLALFARAWRSAWPGCAPAASAPAWSPTRPTTSSRPWFCGLPASRDRRRHDKVRSAIAAVAPMVEASLLHRSTGGARDITAPAGRADRRIPGQHPSCPTTIRPSPNPLTGGGSARSCWSKRCCCCPRCSWPRSSTRTRSATPATIADVLVGTIVPTALAAAVAVLVTYLRGNGPVLDLGWPTGGRTSRSASDSARAGHRAHRRRRLHLDQDRRRERTPTSAINTVVDGGRMPITAAVVMFLFIWLIGPICEEIIFRGLLWGAIERQQWGRWAAFGLVHRDLRRQPPRTDPHHAAAGDRRADRPGPAVDRQAAGQHRRPPDEQLPARLAMLLVAMGLMASERTWRTA